MNENLKKIIELSKHPWIQEQWKPNYGDMVYHPNWIKNNGDNFIATITDVTNDENENWCSLNFKESGSYSKKELIEDGCIWLPIGVNLETGEFQVDELLFKLIENEERLMKKLREVVINRISSLVGKLELLDYWLKEQEKQSQGKRELDV